MTVCSFFCLLAQKSLYGVQFGSRVAFNPFGLIWKTRMLFLALLTLKSMPPWLLISKGPRRR